MRGQGRAKVFFSGERERRCPEPGCGSDREPGRFTRAGYFTTKWDGQPVRRYRCVRCGRSFSSHTLRPHYRQKRPDLNERIFELYASGMTQRRMALVLAINRKTVVRKILFLAKLARTYHHSAIDQAKLHTTHAQFDEMETFEHTKLKPVTIALVVDALSGTLIDLQAAPIAYKGPLAKLAFRKYGPRPHLAKVAIQRSLHTLRQCGAKELRLTTDCHPAYRAHIRKLLPHATHRPTLRIPIKKTDRKNHNDQLFTLNYTAAKIRNDLSRMARKTWVTTKKIARLQAHLDLYLAWNNRYQMAH